MVDEISFESDLARASTIPADWYADPRVLDLERDRVFARTWQLAGHRLQFTEPGSYTTTTIAGEPVLLVRDREDRFHALSNVCRHRAGPVARGEGCRASFQCGYHGWTYGLDGRLLTTPEFEGVENFDREVQRLPEFELQSWGPLLFVRLLPGGPSLEEMLGPISTGAGQPQLETFRHVHRKDWVVECNWKVYVDNYLEGYHIPIVHPGLFRELDYPNYRTETFDWASIQHSPIKRPRRLRVESPTDEAKFFWVFPNLMLNVYPDNFSTNLILPLGPERTLTIFEWYFRDADAPAAVATLEDTVQFSDEIQIEDIEICEAVQKGLRSRTYSQGRYSVRRENGVHHFHQLLVRSLTEGDSPA